MCYRIFNTHEGATEVPMNSHTRIGSLDEKQTDPNLKQKIDIIFLRPFQDYLNKLSQCTDPTMTLFNSLYLKNQN